MRSLGRRRLIQYDWCPYKKERFENSGMHIGRMPQDMKAEIRVMFSQTKEPTLPTCWSLTASHQNPETIIFCCLSQGSPTPGPRTNSCPPPVRNQAAQQEVSGRQVSEASSAHPYCSHYRLNHTPQSVEKLSTTTPVPGVKKVGGHWHKPPSLWYFVWQP